MGYFIVGKGEGNRVTRVFCDSKHILFHACLIGINLECMLLGLVSLV